VATTGTSLDQALDTYAHQQQAGRTFALHVAVELDTDGIRGLARHVADKARDVEHDGFPRHLLLAGPVSLTTFIGAAWNANGPGDRRALERERLRSARDRRLGALLVSRSC
jgi:hypothetical protein